MRIELQYLERASKTPKLLLLLPEQYFDDVEPAAVVGSDAIPRFDHAADYLFEQLRLVPEQLKWTELRLHGTAGDGTVRTEFYQHGKSWMSHRSDPEGYEEIIHNTQITEKACHVIRTHKPPSGTCTVNYNGIIENLEGGCQAETRFDDQQAEEDR